MNIASAVIHQFRKMKCKRFAKSPSILSIVYYRVDYRELLFGSSLDFYMQKTDSPESVFLFAIAD